MQWKAGIGHVDAGCWIEYECVSQPLPMLTQVAVFRAEVVLAVPSISVRPSLDEMQSAVGRVVQKCVLALGERMPMWEHVLLMYARSAKEATALTKEPTKLASQPTGIVRALLTHLL